MGCDDLRCSAVLYACAPGCWANRSSSADCCRDPVSSDLLWRGCNRKIRSRKDLKAFTQSRPGPIPRVIKVKRSIQSIAEACLTPGGAFPQRNQRLSRGAPAVANLFCHPHKKNRASAKNVLHHPALHLGGNRR